MLVDTHCHLNFDWFDEDREEVLQRALEASVSWVIVPGVDLQASHEAVTLAECYDGVYAAVGVHPNSAGQAFEGEETLAALRELLAHPKVVAVGEIGLDYYRDKTSPERQVEALWAQLTLAAEAGKPVILHDREATTDMLAMLAQWQVGQPNSPTGVFHSFSGTWEEAKRALEMGFYLGFSGPITYKKAERTRQVATNTPIDRILVETDAPFLTPHPHRGKRNEPAYVRYVVEKLAEVRDESLDLLAQQTTMNAATLFEGIGKS